MAATEKKKHMAFFGSSSGSSNKQIDTHNMEHQQNPDEVSSCFHARSIELVRAILELLEGFEFTQNVVSVTTTTIMTTCGMCKHRNILLTKSWSKSSSLHVGEACYNDIESQISYSYEYVYINIYIYIFKYINKYIHKSQGETLGTLGRVP